jgi:SpoVK/Ycf46/Vps4 family AAA+-type ATPase
MSIPRFLQKARQAPLETTPLVRLWLLRLLVPLNAHRSFITRHGFACDAVAEAVGLGEWVDAEDKPHEPPLIRTELRKLHEQAEAAHRQATAKNQLPACLAQNIGRLAALVGLSDTDRSLLAFVVFLHSERVLDDAADWLGPMSSAKVFHALAALLDLPLADVRTALGTQGVLARSGLVSMERNGAGVLRSKLDLLSDHFADHISSHDADPIHLLRDVVSLSSPPTLDLHHHDHLSDTLAVLRPYLRHALSTGRQGVNIFLHGEPGTGKTQLVKALAQDMATELFEVASEDEDGDPVTGSRRLRAFRAAQSFFGSRRALILFDEVEDVFNDGEHLGSKSTAQSRKAWINRTLEENPVPTFWLSNTLAGLDPAMVRRFDMVCELPVPPKRQRERILGELCADLLDEPTRARLASAERLAPAVVSRSASVVRAIATELGPQGSAQAFELLVNQTLQAQGHPKIVPHDPSQRPLLYDPAFIQADADLLAVARGLAQARTGRLCLYGPPGTGKTAYAHWLADQLNRPVLVKRASDLMSKYLGESEQNMARAFRQAREDDAVLLIDEVDSLLQDRRHASHNWEVSLVNEMLTQMEAFPGVFIASTNLMAQLDQAALRRFDLKVKFGFLTPEQAKKLFFAYSKQLNKDVRKGDKKLEMSSADASEKSFIPTPPISDAAWEAELQQALARMPGLTQLTPGDFAAVLRQSRLSPIASPLALWQALSRECALKEGAAQGPMGFLM